MRNGPRKVMWETACKQGAGPWRLASYLGSVNTFDIIVFWVDFLLNIVNLDLMTKMFWPNFLKTEIQPAKSKNLVVHLLCIKTNRKKFSQFKKYSYLQISFSIKIFRTLNIIMLEDMERQIFLWEDVLEKLRKWNQKNKSSFQFSL